MCTLAQLTFCRKVANANAVCGCAHMAVIFDILSKEGTRGTARRHIKLKLVVSVATLFDASIVSTVCESSLISSAPLPSCRLV
jgi:hypothetical protein